MAPVLCLTGTDQLLEDRTWWITGGVGAFDLYGELLGGAFVTNKKLDQYYNE
jgi:hypothetical protein